MQDLPRRVVTVAIATLILGLLVDGSVRIDVPAEFISRVPVVVIAYLLWRLVQSVGRFPPPVPPTERTSGANADRPVAP